MGSWSPFVCHTQAEGIEVFVYGNVQSDKIFEFLMKFKNIRGIRKHVSSIPPTSSIEEFPSQHSKSKR